MCPGAFWDGVPGVTGKQDLNHELGGSQMGVMGEGSRWLKEH